MRSMLSALIIFICLSLIMVSADAALPGASIEINLASNTLSLYKGGVLVKEYPVCVGKPSTVTPEGAYKIIYKTVDPYWLDKGKVVPPGPQNPLGVRWLGITKSIGIHGNNKPSSIGSYASAGCIRMYNKDVIELYEQVPLNTPVKIKYERVSVFEDKYSGSKAVIIYPDAYNRGAKEAKAQLQRFKDIGVAEAVLEKAGELLGENLKKPQVVSAGGIGVFLNDSLVTCDAFEEQGDIFIGSKAAEDVLGLTAEAAGIYSVDARERESAVYVNLSKLIKGLGGSISFDASSGNAYVSANIIKINGVLAGINQGDYDKADFLAAEAVKQLGYEYSEDNVDVRIFGKPVMKVKRNNSWSVNVDNICQALEGSKTVVSRYRTVEITLPTYLKLGEEYYRTERLDGRLVMDAESAFNIYENSYWAIETFAEQERIAAGNVDVETFLEDYSYKSNIYGTVIEIELKQE